MAFASEEAKKKEALSLLKQHWGYADFRPDQWPIVSSILDGNDTLALLPTGGGKSICFQVPGLMLSGLTLVVSPLIALMKDQVEQLKKRNIRALCLHSGMDWKQQKIEMENALRGHYSFLYVAPERLLSVAFREYLPQLKLSLLVVDEAHCLSMWGQDFRPSYKRIHELRSELGLSIPMTAFTASAPTWIQEEISQGLQLHSPRVFQGDFARPNLRFRVLETENRWQQVLAELKTLGFPQSDAAVLLFGATRKEVQETAAFLVENQMPAQFYHAGLSHAERSQRQKRFMNGTSPIMVCTNAFGMGVDKPNVRLVVHLAPPACPEDYYQEAGRAGRDGDSSDCLLLYMSADFQYRRKLIERQFLPEKALRRLYNAALNAASVLPGRGADQRISIDLEALCKTYNLASYESFHGLKLLENLGVWTLSESGSIGSVLRMKMKADSVYEFKILNPDFEDVLDALMRNLPGLFQSDQTLRESNMCRKAACSEAEFVAQLQRLQARGVLEYQPAQGGWQAYLLEDRHDSPRWDMASLELLKKRRLEAVDQLQSYAEAERCRAQFWQRYFVGESAGAAHCGRCDTCLKSKREQAWSQFCTELEKGACTRQNLLERMPGLDAALLSKWVKKGLQQAWIGESQGQGLFLVDGQTPPLNPPN
ncbi:MAG: RecQ family ATP-dependent DNA helicase [Bacteroidia bacterium]